MPDFRVVVIGAGLGGLALAQGLRQAGVEVAVYERDAALTSRRQGYRLHLDSEAHDCLLRLLPSHLGKLFLATAGMPDPRFVLLDEQLNQVMSQHSGQTTDFAVDRLVLRQILLSGIEDAVVFGKQFRGYETGSDGRVTAHFADGSQTGGDVLVAADGVNSVVRKQYLPHARVVDTGVRQIYGTIPLTQHTRALFDDTMFGIFTAVAGRERTFLGIAPVEFPEPPQDAAARLAPGTRLPPTSDYMTCSFGARREWFGDNLSTMSGPDLHEIMSEGVRGWHARVREIVAHCDPATMFAFPLRTSVPISPWPATPITLVGDAIHAMSPAAGAGACTALRDADRLTSALTAVKTGAHNLVDAIRDYESDMTDHGFTMVRTAAANGQRFLGQDPLPGQPS
ncbi:2-polyprenyl-6-methoxyphenol hydroxylase-like FAD-dependent oxidoreductase [Kibdelosporangium banguiense]|uniref:2-polyprenyl-6-methoxyphenol hydroxylase-like FAD-dependent oxidoreductase n=1 Tax=Kibdelosporangium banguiense TaxID=1365924 RepID=A0ABS4TQ18_9PSEU|nr:FAD-dependent monooxygenase [Kibdelosporangium banguiense]MBP2326502.1 2-polyprenyl-6-methoxyphenol hydroxylase-like FAD-dependent oxidoreductase [Kibdelosporangium banguiense]